MMRDPDGRRQLPPASSSSTWPTTRGLDHKGKLAQEFGYCPFGNVIRGLDVVTKNRKSRSKTWSKDGRPFEQCPVEPVVIQQVTSCMKGLSRISRSETGLSS